MKVMTIMDSEGYPTKEALEHIKQWDVLRYNVTGLIDFIQEVWRWDDMIKIRNGFSSMPRGFKKKVIKLEMHTGGWSGNEDIIGALKKQDCGLFFLYCESEHRGGHYYFEIPIDTWEKKLKADDSPPKEVKG